ncbi:MAG: response regulator, partial [Desulfobulbaceae bacterium]|nr:response regulator [Desulfobulbaceae bacterium]
STILIVEDSKFFMNQLCDFVAEAGYTPLQAFDGIEALKVLENESVGLILTDIEMPNMDGLEMTERIRSNPDMKDMPIIAVTSVAGDAAEKRGIQAGVNEYMIKLDREKIINTIDRYLS